MNYHNKAGITTEQEVTRAHKTRQRNTKGIYKISCSQTRELWFPDILNYSMRLMTTDITLG